MKHIRKILSAILVLTLVLTSNIIPAMACSLEGAEYYEEPTEGYPYGVWYFHERTVPKDENGNPNLIVVPCEKVATQGYCDIPTVTGLIDYYPDNAPGGTTNLLFCNIDNPYYDAEKVTRENDTVYFGGGSATQGTTTDLEPGLIGDPDGNGPDPDYWEQDENGEWVLKENVELDENGNLVLKENVEENTAPVETPAVTEMPVAVDEQRFADVAPDAWYYDAVNTMAINGILNGYPDGQFHPDNYVTEAELLTIIYRLATTDEPWSKDDCGHWAGRIINTLHHTRVRTVYTMCNNLHADEYANRGEATTAIIALLKDAGRITYDSTTNRWTSNYYTKIHDWTHPYDDDVANYISDWEAIKFGRPEGTYSTTVHEWFSARIVAMYEFGFVHGKDTTGTFDPAGHLTRAELCQMLANAGITECLNITLDIDDWGYGG